MWSQNIEKMLNVAINYPLKKVVLNTNFTIFFFNFWAFLLLGGLVSNIFTFLFRGSEVCLERFDSYGNFGYLEKNQTFLF